MSGGVIVRAASLDDAAAIAAVYNQGIEDRVATFETEPRSAAAVKAVLERMAGTHPAVVVEHDGAVVGFGWTGPYSKRPCYSGIAEFSVYVARGRRGSGAGRQVLEALIGACEALGFWKLTSRVFVENQASRRLCAATGFREVGVHVRHARLDGRWRDVVVVERLLGPARAKE